MEIVKQNETYLITDVTDSGWRISGNITNDLNGAVSLSINIYTKEDSDYIGDFYYHNPKSGNINMSYNVAEENRDAMVAYADTVIDFVLEQFKN